MKKPLIPMRVKCISALVGLSLLGLGPLPFTEILGFFIITKRPRWFKAALQQHYAEAKSLPPANMPPISGIPVARHKRVVLVARVQSYAALTAMAVVGFAFVPATDILSFYVFLTNAPWFARLVERLYLDVDPTPIFPEIEALASVETMESVDRHRAGRRSGLDPKHGPRTPAKAAGAASKRLRQRRP